MKLIKWFYSCKFKKKKNDFFLFFLLRCHVYSQNESWRGHFKCPSLELGNML